VEWNANEEDFPAWLRRIAAGVAVRWHRRNPNEPLTETYPLDLARNMKEAQALDRLEKAMDTLSRTERTLLEQDSRAGLRVDAMAAVCHISPSEVAALKERALERLAAAYAAQQSLI
jgi:DNA-directed RNA polymerase specialized sigma24 family protein